MQTIKTALLSFGLSGKVFHAPFIHFNKGYELVAVWERSRSESRIIYPAIKIARSLDELLADNSIDLIVVNTPTATHYEFAKKALLAGKHVVVEKAFTTTVEEAIELNQLAKEKNRCLSVFQNRRWDSDFQTIQKVVQDGVLGPIHGAEFHFDRYKETLSPKLHKEMPAPGAGLLYDLGPHLIDQALCLFGMPLQLFADIRTLRPNSQVDDSFDLLLLYPSLRVRLKSSLLVKEPQHAFVLHGLYGSFIKPRADVQEAALMAGHQPNQPNWGKEPDDQMGLLNSNINGKEQRIHIPSIAGNYGHFYSQLYDAINGHAKNPVPAEDGIRVMQILEAAVISSRTHTKIDLSTFASIP